ncbi:hypothetical protein F6X00_14095 [Vibrio vulnificus]|nr:hypothetical protein F6X00_14095 [Vibrio vulnificus]
MVFWLFFVRFLILSFSYSKAFVQASLDTLVRFCSLVNGDEGSRWDHRAHEICIERRQRYSNK